MKIRKSSIRSALLHSVKAHSHSAMLLVDCLASDPLGAGVQYPGYIITESDSLFFAITGAAGDLAEYGDFFSDRSLYPRVSAPFADSVSDSVSDGYGYDRMADIHISSALRHYRAAVRLLGNPPELVKELVEFAEECRSCVEGYWEDCPLSLRLADRIRKEVR